MRSRISGVTASSFSGGALNPACAKNGSSRAAQLLHRQRADMLGVEPHRLGIERDLLQ